MLPEYLAVLEEDELRKKSWKTIENTSINLYYIDFLIVIKKNCKKLTRIFSHTNLID